MSTTEFDDQRGRYTNALSTTHATIADALSGRRLDVFEQCVPIKIVADGAVGDEFRSIQEVKSLSQYLHMQAEKRVRGESACTAILVVAGPAAGKTCMTSQMVMQAFQHEKENRGSGLIPIQIKVMDLQRRLAMDELASVFARCW
eukprot:COSAG01_NODE_29091_length_645_cov_1.723443_1_plen_144_part_10